MCDPLMRVLSVLMAGGLLLGATNIAQPAADAEARARRNGTQATRAFDVSHRIMHGWLARRDAVTGLLPHRGRFNGSTPDPSWVVANTAADLYPFMVMAASRSPRCTTGRCWTSSARRRC